jgi:DNA-binding response OmpR family regulator
VILRADFHCDILVELLKAGGSTLAKILLIEDDVDMAEMVVDGLTAARHTVEVVHNGQHGWDMLQGSVFDLIVLDWELPEMHGIEVLRRFRAEGGKTPVIMLTGNSGIAHKERGFETGADDYLPKPFNIRELELRVRALLRRAPLTGSNELQVRDLVLDAVKHKVTRNGQEVHLLPRDFALLEFFMRHPNEIFSSDSLLARVWHQESDASQEGLRVAIRRVRKAVDSSDDLSESIIENVPRVGYRLRS